MAKNITLSSLRLLELNVLIQHLQLGKNHLKKYLNNKQFNELVEWGELTDAQEKHHTINHAERSGNFLLALNTVFTCGVGTWLGVAGFLDLGIGSKIPLLVVLFVTALVSTILGYYNYKYTKNNSQQNLINQKLLNFQLKLAKTINTKRNRQIENITAYLHKTICPNQDKTELHEKFHLNSQESVLHWIHEFNSVYETKAADIPNPVINKIYLKELSGHETSLKKWLDKNLIFEVNDTEKTTNLEGNQHTIIKTKYRYKNNHTLSFLEILTDPSIAIPKIKPIKRSWLRTNFINLLIGFLPTVLGGFGSMFVYLDGIPKIAKEFGFDSAQMITRHPTIRPLEIALALSITLFFGYTFAINNFKNFQREAELDIIEKKITNEETHNIEIEAKLNTLRKIKYKISQFLAIFQRLIEISNYLEKKVD